MCPDPASDPRVARDRHAIEHIIGHPLPQEWPTGALAPGTRVRVIRDTEWDGPWATEFLGTIDTVGAPEPIGHPRAWPGKLQYWRYRRNLWMSPWHENAAYLPP